MGIAAKVIRRATRYKGTGALIVRAPIAFGAKATLTRATALAAKAATASKAKATLTVVAGGVNVPFTASNGTAWPSPFVAKGSPSSGATATIQSNRGQLHLGTVGGYSDMIGRGYTPASNDYTISFDIYLSEVTGEQFHQVMWRCSGDQSASYMFEYGITSADGQYISIYEHPGFEDKGSEGGMAYVIGDVIHVVIIASGSNHSVKWWREGDSEPGSPNVSFADATLTTGDIVVRAVGGNAASAHDHQYDNFVSNVAAA